MNVQKLFNAKNHRKLGAHRSVVIRDPKTKQRILVEFYHHNTQICEADVLKKTYFISDEGYASRTTHRALVEYINFFEDLGYRMDGCYIANTRFFPYKFTHR